MHSDTLQLADSPLQLIFFRDGVSEVRLPVSLSPPTCAELTSSSLLHRVNSRKSWLPRSTPSASLASASTPSTSREPLGFVLSGSLLTILARPSSSITYIVCGKRHHISMFPVSPNDGDKTGNVKAGVSCLGGAQACYIR